jgi:adenylate cyclase
MWNDFAAFIFGRPAQRQLPERVRAAIGRQQVQAEILIGWTQFALVLFFFALYTIAPKPADGMLFHPVPWVLSSFLVFTLVRLALAHRRIIATWFLAGSVVADIGLLLLLIWSFHIQYAQPAAFYLKAPTLLYVFLFIALRTLRFDPTYVIIAGVSAAVGWAVLVVLAVTEPSLMPLITRDYILYLTSNRVLIGAEVDKILCILIVTAVLAVAIIRARHLLMQSVADATVAHDLTRFVAPEVASQIVASERAIEPGDGEVLTASVLFCDIEGFSTISERLSPDELMQTLNEYFAAVSEVVDRYDGVLIAYQGDAMLIGFNTVRPDPDHAAHALSTAIGIQEMVDRRRFGDGLMLKTRCGINTGRLVAGAVGTPERLLFTVYGDEVNIAARLEQLNKSFGTYILATEQTLAAAGRGFACRPMGSVQVRGRLQPVTVFAVDGPALEESSPATRLAG